MEETERKQEVTVVEESCGEPSVNFFDSQSTAIDIDTMCSGGGTDWPGAHGKFQFLVKKINDDKLSGRTPTSAKNSCERLLRVPEFAS